MEMTKKGFFLSLVLAASGAAFAQPYAAYHDGLIRHIQPKGWINEFLNRQRTGMTGHPEAIAYPYNTCLWAGEIARQNECSFAKDWWRYEQSAYYTDGLLRLGYVLGDTAFINKGERGIRYTIDTRSAKRVTSVELLNPDGTYTPIDLKQNYTLCTSDYCTTGGGAYGKFKQCPKLKTNICRYSDALIEYITNHLGGKIPPQYAQPQGRIKII